MKAICILLLLATATTLHAADYPPQLPDCLRYIHAVEQGQPDTDNPPWVLVGREDKVWISEWKATYPMPTPAHCVSIASNAVAYWANYERTRKADFDGWRDGQLKATIKEELE